MITYFAIFILSILEFSLFLYLFHHLAYKKTYRLIITLLSSFSLGVLVFLVYGVGFTIDKDGNYLILDIATFIFLFLTWLGALWAARESFDQKNISNKTIKEMRQQNDYEMRPYIRLRWNSDSDEIIFIIDNKGRGLAKDIVFEPILIEGSGFFGLIQIMSRPIISSGPGSEVKRQELVPVENNEHYQLKYEKLKSFLLHSMPMGYRIICRYEDLVGNKYKAVFVSDDSYNDKFRIEKQNKI